MITEVSLLRQRETFGWAGQVGYSPDLEDLDYRDDDAGQVKLREQAGKGEPDVAGGR